MTRRANRTGLRSSDAEPATRSDHSRGFLLAHTPAGQPVYWYPLLPLPLRLIAGPTWGRTANPAWRRPGQS